MLSTNALRAAFDIKALVLASSALSFLECLLILLNIIPPILTYSPPNMAFALAYFAILALGGWESHSGLKEAAKAGALISLGRLAVVIIAAIVGYQIGTPVIGMEIPPGMPISALYLFIIIENLIVAAIISAAFALIGRFAKKKLK